MVCPKAWVRPLLGTARRLTVMKPTLQETNAISNFPSLKVDAFLLNALNSSLSDRDFVVRVETHILSRLFKHCEDEVTFYDLNSYFRMLVHRVTRYYELERTADCVLRTVTVYRPPSSPHYRQPIVKLAEFVEPQAHGPPTELKVTPSPPAAPQKLTIMKRSATAEPMAKEAVAIPVRTLEEREREYEAVRARIFHSEEETASAAEFSALSQSTVEETNLGKVAVADAERDYEVVHFKGWKDIDAIKPFIPAIIPAADPIGIFVEAVEGEFDFSAIWVPQHIFTVKFLPIDEVALRQIKAKCKRRHCRLHPQSDATRGILLFTYRVGESDAQISDMLGLECERWRPFFLPEPPI